MKRTFLLVALLAIFGSAFSAVSVYVVDNSKTIYSYTDVSGGGASTVTTALSFNGRGIDLYNGVLTVTIGDKRPQTWLNVNATTGSEVVISLGNCRMWASVVDQATGELYASMDNSNSYACRYADILGNSLVQATRDVEQGYDPGGDAAINGSKAFFTSYGGNSSGRYLWSLPLGFASGTVGVAEFDANPYGNSLSGIAFDGAGNVYLGVNNNSVIKLNSSFVYQSTIVTGLSNVKDVDFFGGELFVCNSLGVSVYSTAGAFSRTFGPTNATGLVIGGVAAPPTTVDFVCTVTLVDWNGASLPTVTVTVDGGTPVVKTLTGSGSSGTFTLSLTPVSHDIKVKAVKSLSQTVTGSGTTPAFFLQCGDTNDDNKIDDLDFLSVIGNFGSTDPVLKLIGDGNGDDKTDDLDFLNVIGKFGTSGT